MYFFLILINMKIPVHISLSCNKRRAALEGSRRREGAISSGARPNPGAASFLHPISLITSITWSLHLGRLDTLGATRATLDNTTQSGATWQAKATQGGRVGFLNQPAPGVFKSAFQRSQTPHLPPQPTGWNTEIGNNRSSINVFGGYSGWL